jgi:peroxiredoxin/mono/diheme cytochrome c family protein
MGRIARFAPRRPVWLTRGRLIRWAVLAVVVSATVVGVRLSRRGSPPPPARVVMGRRVADFTLRDASGRGFSLGALRDRTTRAFVLYFSGIDCPVGNLYLPRLAELARAYGPRGVSFVGINSNAHEDAETIARHAREHGLPFPMLKDPFGRVADQLGVERTCEALVLDAKGHLLYRGAIDDQYRTRARQAAPARSYLAEALDAVLAGRAVPVARTEVVGCPIEFAQPRLASNNVARVSEAAPQIIAIRDAQAEAAPVAVGTVTYADQVAPILQEKCQGCHRPGQVGPFSLLTYDDARRWAAGIAEVVDDYRMPPWHADPRHGRFANDRSLSPRQRATLLAWVEQGAPAGDLARAPAPRAFAEDWSIGKPDAVFAMPEPFAVPADGTVEYQHFRVPTRFAEDRWIQAAEVRPGDRSVVHHIGVYVDDGRPRPRGSDREARPVLACYFPGDQPTVLPPGVAKRIPAGADLYFEVHYTPVGVPRRDRSSIGLIFAREPVQHQAVTRGIPNKDFVIPPRSPSHEVRSSYIVPAAARLLSLMPHMHLRGKDFLYRAVYPDGTSEILLSVPAYDFAWQASYRLAEPMRLPRGTRIECVAHFDNSPDNPANPDPDHPVAWGEQSWEEMMIGYIDYYEDASAVASEQAAASRR